MHFIAVFQCLSCLGYVKTSNTTCEIDLVNEMRTIQYIFIIVNHKILKWACLPHKVLYVIN